MGSGPQGWTSACLALLLCLLVAPWRGGCEDADGPQSFHLSDGDVEGMDHVLQAIKAKVEGIQAVKEKATIPHGPSPDRVQEGIGIVEERLAAYAAVVGRYNGSLIEGEVLDEMYAFHRQTNRVLSQVVAETSHGAKAEPAAFSPFVPKVTQLQADLRRLNEQFQAQIEQHLDLLQRAQDLISRVGNATMSEDLYLSVTEGYKQRAPLTKGMLEELHQFELGARRRLWLGVTPRELGLAALLAAECFGAYVAVRAVALLAGVPVFRWPVLDYTVALICMGRAYSQFVWPVQHFIAWWRLIALVAFLLALGCAGCRTQQRIEGWVQRRFVAKKAKRVRKPK
eukprot:EG_transcript_16969